MKDVLFGYNPDIDGEGGKSQAIQITKAEAERLVRAYLDDIVGIEAEWKLTYTTGSWAMRWKPYSWDRIDHFIESGIIAAEKVDQMAKEAYEPLNAALASRAERLRQIAVATGAIIEGGKGKLGDIVLSLGYEWQCEGDEFCLHVKKSGTSATEVFKTVPEAVEWVNSFVTTAC